MKRIHIVLGILLLFIVGCAQDIPVNEPIKDVPVNDDALTNEDIPTLLEGESITVGDSYDCPDKLGESECVDYDIVCGDPSFMADTTRGPIDISLMVKRREASSPIGHITFQTGGYSGGLYSKPSIDPNNIVGFLEPQYGGRDILLAVLDAGYSTYELSFTGEIGPWTNAINAGYIEADCGTSVIIKYIDWKYVNPGEALCSTGNSHGGFSIAHGLHRKNLAEVLDAVVFAGSPYNWALQAFGTVEEGGFMEAPDSGPNPDSPDGHDVFQGWQGIQPTSTDYLNFGKEWYPSLCQRLQRNQVASSAGPACKVFWAYASGNLGLYTPTQKEIDTVQRVSTMPLGEGDNYEFPNLAMSFVWASEDATQGQNHGWLYYNHVTAGKGKSAYTVTESNQIGEEGLDHKVHGIAMTDSGSVKVTEYFLDTCKDSNNP